MIATSWIINWCPSLTSLGLMTPQVGAWGDSAGVAAISAEEARPRIHPRTKWSTKLYQHRDIYIYIYIWLHNDRVYTDPVEQPRRRIPKSHPPRPLSVLAYMFLERRGLIFHGRRKGSCLLELAPSFCLGCGYLNRTRRRQAVVTFSDQRIKSHGAG